MDKKEIVLKVEVYDDKTKTKAMQTASRFLGIESVKIDMKNKKLFVTGDIDAVCLTSKLRKHCCTVIDTVGPVKQPQQEKKQEKPENKESKEKQNDKEKDKPKPPECCPQWYPPPTPIVYYYGGSSEEYPSACCTIS